MKGNESKDKQVRTYMSFTLPVDPANVRTMPDLDLSYALASTLVKWNAQQEIIGDVASEWRFSSENAITFTIDPLAKWSDGSSITATDVVASFERAKRRQGDSLQALFGLIDSISAPDHTHVLFKLNTPAKKSGIVRKLTEPMYGIVKDQDHLKGAPSSGPFRLVDESEEKLELHENVHWREHSATAPQSVLIRKLPVGDDVEDRLLKESWANLLSASSFIETSSADKFTKAKYKVWDRSLDKTMFLTFSPHLASESGVSLLETIDANLDRKQLLSGLQGYKVGNQIFPIGLPLHDEAYTAEAKPKAQNVKPKFKKLVILGIAERLSAHFRKNLISAIKSATGVEPTLKIVELAEIEKYRMAGDYDLNIVALPVGDPNGDGFMSFVIDPKSPYISSGKGAEDFKTRLAHTKLVEDVDERNKLLRGIIVDAVKSHRILPILHYSSVAVAKGELDLSGIPMSDESIAFSKIRFLK